MLKTRTQKEFWELLAKAVLKRALKADADGWIRQQETRDCPIMCVARLEGLRGYSNISAGAAAIRMGYDKGFAEELMEAADNNAKTDKAKRIRRRLLRMAQVSSSK